MASSEDDNNDSEMGFQYRGEMSSGSMFNNKSSSGSGNNLFGSGWDPLDNFGGSSSMVGVPHYPENHQVGGLIHHHYQSGSAIADLVPKVASFGSGSFSEMVNPFGNNLNPECGGSSSPNSRDKRKAPNPQFNPIKNGKREDGSSDEKKQRIEANWKGKQMGKQTKENSTDSGKDNNNYIHVRAKRGQATNSHSLAERVRRERISERMKLLQELVPGCNKITGKAVMLDEIINYVQSLQQQVEFLSMKLATVNPELNIDIERLVFKDMVHSRGSSSNPGYGYSSSHSYPHGSLTGIPTTNAPLHPIHPQQPVWDNDLHNLLQMGFDANLGHNGGGGKMDV